MPRIGNKVARELRDQRMIELYAAGTSVSNLAKEFNLHENAVMSALSRHPEDLEKATRRINALQAAVYRRGASILSNKILLRAETMEDDEAKKMRAGDAEKWSGVMSDFAKQAQLAEGKATERNEGNQPITIIHFATPTPAEAAPQ